MKKKEKILDNPELAARAVRMYKRFCDKNNAVFQQPTGGGTVRERDGQIFVDLENFKGRLATYRYDPDKNRLFSVEAT